jgi:O-antigen/teichoic acid export membrane protein
MGIDRDGFEGRLARVTPLGLVLSQAVPFAIGVFFLVANLATGQTAWAIVFGVLLVLQAVVVIWWARVRAARRREASFTGISRRAPSR